MADAPVDRDQVLRHLRGVVQAMDWVQAAWMGGSDATGRTDAYSDMDLQLVCDPTQVQATFEGVERALEAWRGIAHTWPVGHAHDADYQQRFYNLVGAPEHVMVDLCVMRPDRVGIYLDPDRHGTPVVWFDRTGVLVAARDPTVAQHRAARLEEIRVRHPLFAHLAGKQLARGDLVAATWAYHRFLLWPLVELLRIRHCPTRWDFGMRYLDRDLPEPVRTRLLELVLAGSAEALGICIARARTWIDEELAATVGSR